MDQNIWLVACGTCPHFALWPTRRRLAQNHRQSRCSENIGPPKKIGPRTENFTTVSKKLVHSNENRSPWAIICAYARSIGLPYTCICIFAAVLQLTVFSEMSDHSTTSDEDEITRSNEVHVGDDLFSSSEVYNYLVSKQYRGKHQYTAGIYD